MISTSHDIKGRLTIQKHNAQGELIEERTANNSITTAGRELVANLFMFNVMDSGEETKTPIRPIRNIHMGKSNKAFDANQTDMVMPVGKTKIDKIEFVSTGNERVRLRIVGELDTDNCNDTLQEAGLFTDDETPVMYNRVTFDTITKSAEFKLTLIWEITF